MSRTINERVDETIRSLEDRLAKWQAIREALNDPVLYAQLRGMLVEESVGREAGNDVCEKSEPRIKSKIFKALRDFFAARGNEWATISQMVGSGSYSKPTLRQVLYISHGEEFERRRALGGKVTEFRLKDKWMSGAEVPKGEAEQE